MHPVHYKVGARCYRYYRYLVGLQRRSIRLPVYQASLVDEYPPFSFADTPTNVVPGARAVR